MARPLPIAADIVPLVEKLIDELGPDAFRTNGSVQLYSGPREVIAQALHLLARNHDRAVIQAQHDSSTLIDDTAIGLHLGQFEGLGIYEYFEKQYEEIHGPDSPLAFAEADKVMRFASRAFIKTSFGHVATAVCGADTNRIFFAEELPELIENDRIKQINGVSAQRIRDAYAKGGEYAAFRRICQAEIAMAYARAKQDDTTEAREDYSARRKFFMMERRETIMLNAENRRRAADNVAIIHSSLTQAEIAGPPASQIRGSHPRLRHTGLHQ